MDIWKYYGVTHRDHLVCNPTSEAKINELVDLVDLPENSLVVDIACGKAEQLLRIVGAHEASGIGVDISPYEIKEANRRAIEQGLQDSVELIEDDGANLKLEPNSVDLAMCLGASWVFDGHKGSLTALKQMTKPGGLVVVGEPFRLGEVPAGYIEAEPDFASTLLTHEENVEIGSQLGLDLLYAIVSNQDDWDRYEGLNLRAATLYKAEHPEDPDSQEILDRQRKSHETYLKYGRDHLNWAIYIFRKPN